ncbi:MAG: NAD(+)/NADH kinase [Bacillota bacterium]
MILISKLGIFVNIKKDKAIKMAGELIDYLQEENIPYLVEKRSAECFSEADRAADFQELREEIDYLVLFGGDGTLLRAARHFSGTGIPLLGINIGSLGFMTVIEVGAVENAVKSLLRGDFEVENRMMLSARVYRNGDEVYHGYGLNDVVINRGANFKLIGIELSINDQYVSQYHGDGLIVSTSTGSTAYSLSAGGPIVSPELDVLLVTPICPHDLYIRPLVISGNDEVWADLEISGRNMKVSIDGRCGFDLQDGDKVKIKKADAGVSLVKFPERDFYKILREKMRVGVL